MQINELKNKIVVTINNVNVERPVEDLELSAIHLRQKFFEIVDLMRHHNMTTNNITLELQNLLAVTVALRNHSLRLFGG